MQKRAPYWAVTDILTFDRFIPILRKVELPVTLSSFNGKLFSGLREDEYSVGKIGVTFYYHRDEMIGSLEEF